MHVAAIVPTSVLGFTTDLDYHMMLPGPALKSGSYREFYANHRGFKILDNGAAENEPTTNAVLMDLAHKLGADEVVVPDKIGDAEETIRLAQAFERIAVNFPHIRFMGVIQGQTHEEYTRSFYQLRNLEYIDTIGIPRNMAKTLGSVWCRSAFIETMASQFPEVTMHALGAFSWTREVAVLADLPCRSIDTSLPAVLGIEGMDIRKAAYIDRQHDFFNRKLDDELARKVILDNISTYRDWAGDYYEKTSAGSV